MHRPRLIVLACAAVAVLAGCQVNSQASARNIPLSDAAIGRLDPQDWTLGAVEVVVPLTLSVSEDNSIKPRADIVWREDVCCDRHTQVDALMTTALTSALAPMTGSQPVRVELQVTRFHAVTERTRYSIGGEHEIEFFLTVFDATNGTVLRGPRPVDLTFPAAGGDRALANEARGYYQRDAISDRLTAWAQVEFGLADLTEPTN
ncbi:MAG: DUF6778 family protein [Pseudomonadota bacterium]